MERLGDQDTVVTWKSGNVAIDAEEGRWLRS